MGERPSIPESDVNFSLSAEDLRRVSSAEGEQAERALMADETRNLGRAAEGSNVVYLDDRREAKSADESAAEAADSEAAKSGAA